jgi:predicted transcriptional regulator
LSKSLDFGTVSYLSAKYNIGIIMKTLKINQFDKKDEEIVDALISLGMSKPAARMLAYIQQVNEATSVELEMGTGLRQPEVSIAAKQLEESYWINEREEKKLGKGRPFKVYSLKVGFEDIIAHLEKQQKKLFDEGQGKIERLKELGK